MPPRTTVPPVAAANATRTAPADLAVPFKVRATKLGFLDQRRRPGDVFVVTEKQFADAWMERVDPATPVRAQSAQEAAREGHKSLLAGPPQLQKNGADLEDDEDDEKSGKATGDKDVLG